MLWILTGQASLYLGTWLTESLGGHSQGQRSPGRLDILQEGNPKGTGVGSPYVLKGELLGGRLFWLNRELLR